MDSLTRRHGVLRDQDGSSVSYHTMSPIVPLRSSQRDLRILSPGRKPLFRTRPGFTVVLFLEGFHSQSGVMEGTLLQTRTHTTSLFLEKVGFTHLSNVGD